MLVPEARAVDSEESHSLIKSQTGWVVGVSVMARSRQGHTQRPDRLSFQSFGR